MSARSAVDELDRPVYYLWVAKEGTKKALLEAGARLFAEKGYHNTGIQEVLAATGVPKGSFYHHFASKDDFGLQVIEQHAQAYEQRLERHLGAGTVPPLQRLRGLLAEARREFEGCGCRAGCLIGNLGQELADQNELFRARIDDVLSKWVDRYAECFREAQEEGELRRDLDPRELAEFTVSGLEGALLRAKVTKSSEPLRIFEKILLDEVMKP